jgi:hypothetical protein
MFGVDLYGLPNPLGYFFRNVIANLVASAICAGAAVWRIVKSHNKLHEKLDRLLAKGEEEIKEL